MKKPSLISILFLCFIAASSQPCLPEGIWLKTQAQIDSFQINYPDCTEIEGDLFILSNYPSDITNLNALSVLTSVQGHITISNCNLLQSLTGLDNITYIGGDLGIDGEALTSLSALENLTAVGRSLIILSTGSLISLTGLENVTSIESDIKIGNNKALTSLTGLDNVSYIGGDLNILLNEALTNCEILSICNYLAYPNGVVTIQDNAIGCNSPEEVQDSCEANAVAIDEQYIRDNLILYPNPANQELNISAEGFIIDEVIIYTLTGQQVYAVRPKSETIDISTLPPGMYIVEVMVEGRKVMRKLLIE